MLPRTRYHAHWQGSFLVSASLQRAQLPTAIFSARLLHSRILPLLRFRFDRCLYSGLDLVGYEEVNLEMAIFTEPTAIRLLLEA